MGDDEMTINGLGADAALDHAIDYADDDQLPAAFRGDCGFLTGPAGCVDGEAIVRINRAGKGYAITLADLFVRFHGGKTKRQYGRTFTPAIPTYVRALCGDTLRQHLIKDVVLSGIRPVLKLTLQSGKNVRLTPDHLVCVGIRNGEPVFRRADALQQGDEVLSNGRPVARDALGRKIDADGYVKVLLPHLKTHPRWTHEGVYEHILVVEQVLGRHLYPGEEVHHKNEIKHDNRKENLAVLTEREHKRHHGKKRGFRNMHGGTAGRGGEIWFVPDVDRVLSVVPDGEAQTYDIVCTDPHRNFVANGIVVHNCGKTFLAKALCASRPGWTMAASTGIAAVNLGEATTINSLLGYFDEDSLRTSLVQGWIQAKLRKLHNSGLRRIILDEVSMISGETLTMIMEALDELRHDDGIDIGLTLVGDFCQLPPVPEKLPYAQGRKKNRPVQFAFEAATWERFANNITALTEIRRQADPAFIAALRACRRGDVEAMLEYFGPHCQMTIQDDYPGLTIFSKNDQVDRWNSLMHARVKGAAAEFPAVRDREQKTEWRKHIPDVLALKEGALVMVLANRILGGSYIQYANGDLGTFRGAEDKEVTVVDEEGRATKEKVRCAVVALQRTGREVLVEPVLRHNLVPTGALGVKKARYQVIGSISYLPLRLAYASTVHKIQGLSLDHVQVAFADPFFGSPAMLYVAMSRARSAEGLRLVGTPQLLRERCAVDGRVRSWL